MTSAAQAAERPYSAAAFAELQQQGKPILVFVHAPWCPTCQKQEYILGQLQQQEEFQPITILRVDFDTQKSVVHSYAVKYQSTLIAIRGGDEVGRLTAVTERKVIAQLLRRLL